MGCCRPLCDDLSDLQGFGLNFYSNRAFYECQWRIPHLLYVTIRFAMFIYAIFGLTYFAIEHGDIMMKFFTIWSYILLVVHLGLAAILTLLHYRPNTRPADIPSSLRSNTTLNTTNNVNGQDLNLNHLQSTKDESQPKLILWSTKSSKTTQSTTAIHIPQGEESLPQNGVDNQSYELAEMSNTPSTTLKQGDPLTENALNADSKNINNNSNVKNNKSNSHGSSEPIGNHNNHGNQRSDTRTSDSTTVTATERVPRVRFSSYFEMVGFDIIGIKSITNPSLICHVPSMNESFILEPTPFYIKVSWVLSTITSICAPVVTLIYFTTIYPYSSELGRIGLHDINIHILNTVFVLVDHLLSARPVRVLHAYIGVIFGLFYVIFSVIFWSFDHVNNVVYDIMDWNKPGPSVAVCLGLVILFCLVQLMYFGMYRLKLRLAYYIG